MIRNDRIPKEELRSPNSYLRIAAVNVRSTLHDISFFRTIESLLEGSNCLESRIRVLARVLKGWSVSTHDQSMAAIQQNLVRSDLERAKRLILLYGNDPDCSCFGARSFDKFNALSFWQTYGNKGKT